MKHPKSTEVILSCTTEEQLDVAIEYCQQELAALDPNTKFEEYVLRVRNIERIIGYVQGKLGLDIFASDKEVVK